MSYSKLVHNEIGMERKLKIGILVGNIGNLINWEYRILKDIIEHPSLELALFIKDGRKLIHPLKNQIRKNILAQNVLSGMLYAVQMKIESLLFRREKMVDASEIIDKVKNTEVCYLYPEKKGLWDVFSDGDSNKIKSYDLDVILKHEFAIIKGNILTSARYGIWSYDHADNAINRGEPAGFWEILNNEPCCGVTLHQLTSEIDGELVIDKAWFNWHWAFFKNTNDLMEKSVVLLFKNLDKLLSCGKIETKKSFTYYNIPNKKPSLKYICKYIFGFYSKLIKNVFYRLSPSKRDRRWALFFGKGSFLEAILFRIDPVPMPPGVFWADPFLYEYNEQLYVFFENYSYKTKRGKISVGKVIKDENNRYSVIEVQDILDLNYHLAYPQIIEEDGEIFLMPETRENKSLQIYRCIQFPDKWEPYSTAFEGDEVVDTTYFVDDNGDKWLLLNKGWTHEAELYIYRIDNLKMGSITGHKSNPVLIDCRKGRNGGAIFKHKNEYYRPSQINTHGIYGKGLQISKIKKLTLDEFEDEPVISIEPNFKKNLIGIHHLHQYGNNFVFDACYKKL